MDLTTLRIHSIGEPHRWQYHAVRQQGAPEARTGPEDPRSSCSFVGRASTVAGSALYANGTTVECTLTILRLEFYTRTTRWANGVAIHCTTANETRFESMRCAWLHAALPQRCGGAVLRRANGEGGRWRHRTEVAGGWMLAGLPESLALCREVCSFGFFE